MKESERSVSVAEFLCEQLPVSDVQAEIGWEMFVVVGESDPARAFVERELVQESDGPLSSVFHSAADAASAGDRHRGSRVVSRADFSVLALEPL